jgi:U3 small nucleolar RNA-associated protein 19
MHRQLDMESSIIAYNAMPLSSNHKEPSKMTRDNDDSQGATPSMEIPEMQTNSIQRLENLILDSRLHWNHISVLVDYVRNSHGDGDEEDILAAFALGRIFTRLLDSRKMLAPVGASHNEIMISRWMTRRYESYKVELLRWITSPHIDKSLTALTLVMQFIREDGLFMKPTNDESWRNGIFSQLLKHIVSVACIKDVRKKFINEYLKIYDDVRYYSFITLT